MEKFSIQALSVYDPATLALISSGRVSGITLDVGHSVSHTSVVVDGEYLNFILHLVVIYSLSTDRTLSTKDPFGISRPAQ